MIKIVFVILGIGFFLSIILLAIKEGQRATDQFKEVCIVAKGSPVYNGRNWECIK